MPPRRAENRKPHRFEGSPVIHQGMTVQLFVPILCRGVSVQGSFLPGLPFPAAWRSRAGLGCALSPLEAAWPDSVWAKFLFIFPGFFGAGRLRNVECRNTGKRAVGRREPGLWPCSSFLPLRLWRLQPPLGAPVPSPRGSLATASSPAGSPCLGPEFLATPQALAKLWLPVVRSSCGGFLQKWLWIRSR